MRTSKIDRAKAEARDFTKPCEKVVWVSFYFDAFGHHKDIDEDNISNIGKLWRASVKDAAKAKFSYYYPGLGTPYKPELDLLGIAAWEYEREKKKLKEAAGEQASGEYAKGFAKDVRNKALKKEISGQSTGWWENIKSTTQEVFNERENNLQRKFDIVFKKAERNQYLRTIAAEWRNFCADLKAHPGKAFKIVRDQLAKVSMEYISMIRDTKWVSMLFNTGVDTRLRVAEYEFKKAIELSRTKAVKIKHINIAVFGADMGAATAIGFINHLMQNVCTGDQYEGIPVQLRFVGMFDCVAARYADNIGTKYTLGLIPFVGSDVIPDLKLPKGADNVVHYAAAHEQRWYKPLSTIGGKREFGERLEERLFPGAQEDVTGGYGKHDEGASNQLSRLPLQMMLDRAWRFGVPIIPFDKMLSQKSKLLPLFEMDDNIRPMVSAYWKKALEMASTTTEVEIGAADLRTLSEKQQDADMEKILGIHTCAIPRIVSRTTLPADINAELAGHIALYIAWLRHCCDANDPHVKTGAIRPAGAVSSVKYSNSAQEQRGSITPAGQGGYVSKYRTQAPRKLDFLELKAEVAELERRVTLHPLDSGLSDEQQGFLKIWQSYQSGIVLGETAQLFDKYVHDSNAEQIVAKVTHDFINFKIYFNSRQMTPLGQEKGLFDRWFSIEKGKDDGAKNSNSIQGSRHGATSHWEPNKDAFKVWSL